MRVHVACGILLIGMYYLSTTSLFAQEIDPEIRRALTANAEYVNGIEISGYQERALLVDPAVGLKELNTLESESEFIQRISFSLKILDDNIYYALVYPASKYHSGTSTIEYAFDGASFYKGRKDPRGDRFRPGMLTLHTPKSLADDFHNRFSFDVPAIEVPFLTAAGFTGSLLPEDLGRPIRSLPLSLLETGTLVSLKNFVEEEKQLVELIVRYPEPWASRRPSVTKNTLDIAENDQMQNINAMHDELAGTLRYCRFVLDKNLNYAIVASKEWRETELTLFETSNSDFVKVDGTELWLPRRCEVKSSTYETRPNYAAPRPVYVTSLIVNSLTRGSFSKDQFRIWYEFGGSAVRDYTHEKANANDSHDYIVPATEEELRKAMEVVVCFGGSFTLIFLC